jgi:succinyl-diaminopimelate desuccinylase
MKFSSEEAGALTAQLVALRSYPGEEAACQHAIAKWFAENGMQAELQPTQDNRPNVIVTIKNGEGASLMLNGHIDTVLAVAGWECDPWQGKREGARLYGLGACDMKSGVAANMLVTRELLRCKNQWRGTLIFSSVVDEEAYSLGAHTLIDSGLIADFCIDTEPFWGAACVGGPGKVLVRGEVFGKASHAFHPHDGINAAVEAAKFCAKLETMPVGTHPKMVTTQSVLSLHSGSEQYVITVPEYAKFLITRQIVPGETSDSVLAQMRALADSLNSPARFDFHVDPPYYPSWELPEDNVLLKTLSSQHERILGKPLVPMYTMGIADTNLFQTKGAMNSIMFGPRGDNYHQCNEWVDIDTIAQCAEVLTATTLQLLA